MMYICVRHVVFVRPFFCEQELASVLGSELGSELASELASEALLRHVTPSTFLLCAYRCIYDVLRL